MLRPYHVIDAPQRTPESRVLSRSPYPPRRGSALSPLLARLIRSSDGRERIVHLLHYLECFPLGAHNRVIAQKIEDLLYQGEFLDHERSALRARYRALRDPYMPAIVERLDFG